MSEIIKNRYDFIILFDVENGNPNGDPDAGNMPRIDAETGYGIVTDVCIKRKIRNYVELVKNEQEGFYIYVKEGSVLNNQHERAYKALEVDAKDEKKSKEKLPDLRKWMCKNFYDIRAFGAVMTTQVNCGQVRGPVQLNFGRSIDPIIQQEVTITRMAVTKEGESKTNEMGRKYIVPYGLYKAEGYVSAALAQKTTGFDEDDLELLWEAITNMFEHDHSASRGKMAVRKLVIFKHDSLLGNAPSQKLFDTLTVTRKDDSKPPRQYSDYKITVNKADIPEGVTLLERI